MAKPQKPAPGPFAYVGALLPLVYFGGLIYYFSGVGGGTIQGIVDIGLGPTVAGLSIIGLLFTIQPLLMILRLLMGTPSVAQQGRATSADAGGAETGFDADDAIARYLAQRGAGNADHAAETAEIGATAPPRARFGRKSI